MLVSCACILGLANASAVNEKDHDRYGASRIGRGVHGNELLPHVIFRCDTSRMELFEVIQ